MWNNQMVWNLFFYSHASYCVAGVTLASARKPGRSEPNTVIFHSNPPLPRLQAPGAFWSGVGSRWSRAQILQVSRQSAFSISKSHQKSHHGSRLIWIIWTLARSPPEGGLKYLYRPNGMGYLWHGNTCLSENDDHWILGYPHCYRETLTRQEILPPDTTIIDAKAPALKKRQGSRWKKRRTNLRPARPFLIHMMTAHPTLKFIFQRDLVAMSVPHPLSLLKVLEACADLDYSSRCSNV